MDNLSNWTYLVDLHPNDVPLVVDMSCRTSIYNKLSDQRRVKRIEGLVDCLHTSGEQKI